MSLSFSVTWDYRCPFARNVHEHIVTALESGADWDVRFLPFSLSQSHVEEGFPSVWDEPQTDSGLLALQVGVEMRDRHPKAFLGVHRDLFAARHDRGLNIGDAAVLREILDRHEIDANAVLGSVEIGATLRQVQFEHEAFVQSHKVWGVPTFIVDEAAAFVRLMDRPEGEAHISQAKIERIVSLLAEMPDLNEFKHTTVNS